MNLSDQEIGKKIKQYRKGKMTQQELAVKIGKTESSIRKYEKGLVTIPLNVLEAIASALGTTAFDLMGAEYRDKQYPNMGKDFVRYEAVRKYLETMGFSIEHSPTKGHEEENIDDSGKVVGKSLVTDEYEHILCKDGHTAIFTETEFEELQAGAKEAIEGRFYKKVLEQQKQK